MDGFPTGLFVASAAVMGGSLYASAHMLSESISAQRAALNRLESYILYEGAKNETLRAGLTTTLKRIDKQLAAQGAEVFSGGGAARPLFEDTYMKVLQAASRAKSEGDREKSDGKRASQDQTGPSMAAPAAAALTGPILRPSQEEIQAADSEDRAAADAASNAAK
jgi:hypothetical protein